jgi:hypothetical protein
MYAHALDARLGVLLYASPGVWLVRAGFVTPTRQIEGGFRFSTEDATFRKPRRLPPNRTFREILARRN